MNTTCPHSIEDRETALQPFPEQSFLLYDMERGPDGRITEAQFKKLVTRANILPGNQFSLYEMTGRIQREFCYAMERYVFFYKASDPIAPKFNAAVQDLLTCLDFAEKYQSNGTDINPTASQRPYSWQVSSLQLTEGMANSNDMLELRKDMVSFSQEKNRSARTLLAVYGLLNLTAIGLLIYIARST